MVCVRVNYWSGLSGSFSEFETKFSILFLILNFIKTQNNIPHIVPISENLAL